MNISADMSDSSTRVVKRPGPAMQQTDLSRELGVSQMTISRVLNNQPGVSFALRRRILAKLKQVGYVRDRLATGLRGYPMPIVGLIVPDIRISFFPEIAAAIEQCAMVEDFRVMLGHSHEDYVLECQHIDALLGLRIAGFIIAPACGKPVSPRAP